MIDKQNDNVQLLRSSRSQSRCIFKFPRAVDCSEI